MRASPGRRFFHLRSDRYEDPLQATLERMEIGRVTGGGSQLDEPGGITFADVERELANVDEAVRIVAEAFEVAGAPQVPSSSRYRIIESCASSASCNAWRFTWMGRAYRSRSMPTSIPRPRSQRSTQQLVTAATLFWRGPEETGLFFFGPDAEAMFARVEPVLRRLPIGQNARIVVRYGKQSSSPREIRMPRH